MKNIFMKKILLILITGSLLISSCKKYLDINSDPDTPQNPDPTSVMLAMYPAAADAVQFDGMWLGAYSQMFHARSSTTALTDALTDFHLQIFNRYGQLVFETTDKNKGWDGTVNNAPAVNGNYVYILQYKETGIAGQQVVRGSCLLIK